MCLAIPGKVVDIYREAGLLMARIDYSGTINIACLEYVPEIRLGEYTIVHAGFALAVLDEEEAAKSLAVWQELLETMASAGTDLFGKPLEKKE